MFNKILIANRGEIAVRIIRACKKLGIKTVSISSYFDRNSLHTFLSDENFCFEENFGNIYLNIDLIINLAKKTNSQAIHPGYGFLSENLNFVKKVIESNLIFIGPSAELIEKCGNKLKTLNLAKQFNLNILPNTVCSKHDNVNFIKAKKIGYPILIKSIFGGGGKGIRLVESEKELLNCISLSGKEALLSYEKEYVYMEKYLLNARHLEFQIIGDGKTIFIIGERECSIQKNYQKIIEETPIKKIDRKKINCLKEQCIFFLKNIKYDNIGTIEFLYDDDKFFFIEINPRIQVEHTITENLNNFDILEEQILLSFKKKISFKNKKNFYKGHSMQCRINIENFCKNKIKFLHFPGGYGIRLDTHIYIGYEIPNVYDKMIAKIIVRGKNRSDSIKIMLLALNEIIIHDIETNIPFLIKILSSKFFINNKTKTNSLLNFE